MPLRTPQVTLAFRAWNTERPAAASPAQAADASDQFWTLQVPLPSAGLPQVQDPGSRTYGLMAQLGVKKLEQVPAIMPIRTEGPAILKWLSESYQLNRKRPAVTSRCACIAQCNCNVLGFRVCADGPAAPRTACRETLRDYEKTLSRFLGFCRIVHGNVVGDNEMSVLLFTNHPFLFQWLALLVRECTSHQSIDKDVYKVVGLLDYVCAERLPAGGGTAQVSPPPPRPCPPACLSPSQPLPPTASEGC